MKEGCEVCSFLYLQGTSVLGETKEQSNKQHFLGGVVQVSKMIEEKAPYIICHKHGLVKAVTGQEKPAYILVRPLPRSLVVL